MFKKLLNTFIVLASLLSFNSAMAAVVDRFEIELGSDTVKIGQAVDVTIKAVDKDGNKVDDYEGAIIVLSETDLDAEFPGSLKDQSYKFKPSDAGEVKFENAVKFSTAGEQTLGAFYELDDTISGIASINVVEELEEEAPKEITITSPSNGTTLGEKSIKVSGTSEKNHQIKVIVSDEEYTTQTDPQGVFQANVKDLLDGENIIKAQILDADGKVIGESSEIIITIKSDAPKMKQITLSKNNVEPKEEIEVEVLANVGLSDVSLVFNDAITNLKETEEGLYKGKIAAPESAGEYVIDVTMTDSLGHKSTENGAEKVVVVAKEVVEPIKEEPAKEEPTVDLNAADEEPVTEEPVIEETPDYSINELRVKKLKTKSIIEWNKVEKAESYNIYKKNKETGDKVLVANTKNNSYIVYITGENIEYDDFYVKAVVKNDEGEEVATDLSEATKVQTGPAQILLFFIAALVIAYFVQRRKTA